MRHSIDSSVDDHRRDAPSALTNRQLPQSALQFFTRRLGELLKQGDSGQIRRSPRSEPGLREALHPPLLCSDRANAAHGSDRETSHGCL